MRKLLICIPILSILLIAQEIRSQSKFSDGLALDILKGNYAPSVYYGNALKSSKLEVKDALMHDINADSLKSYLFQMNKFKTRNTGSDTLGNEGIGAARDYALSKFQSFLDQSELKYIPTFFEFERSVCGMDRHKNICAIQPGVNTEDPSIIVIEAHYDSRCHTVCDVDCDAHGMEDNASGSALVLELARVMGKHIYDHTIVYMLTVGEEQGLVGADAFSAFCVNNGINVKAVFNNDIVGGIVCGETSSAPSCPGEGDVDSTQVRMFSHPKEGRQLARWIKEQYREELQEEVSVPMLLSIMSIEDRLGRGGDHIPFREDGFTAMRFTSANEHGDANSSDPDYHDRQHTSDDILGVDRDGDGMIDSFFVDFNYLARNACINGLAASFAALGPDPVTYEGVIDGDSLLITIIDDSDRLNYKIYSRATMQDLDAVYELKGSKSRHIVKNPGSPFAQFISVAAVDDEGIESLFSPEDYINMILNTEGGVTSFPRKKAEPITLLQNRPNPFDEATAISYIVHEDLNPTSAKIVIRSTNGELATTMDAPMKIGKNEVIYYHGYNREGTFIYSLELDGRMMASKVMVFAY